MALKRPDAETVLIAGAAGLAVLYVAWKAQVPPAATLGKLSGAEKEARVLFYRRMWPFFKEAERLKSYPAEFIAAMAAWESNWGRSRFAREGNNYFGLRGEGSWKGRVIYRNEVARTEPFRAYPDPLSSVIDHADLIMTRWPSNYGRAAELARQRDPRFFYALQEAQYPYAGGTGKPEVGYSAGVSLRYAQVLEVAALA